MIYEVECSITVYVEATSEDDAERIAVENLPQAVADNGPDFWEAVQVDSVPADVWDTIPYGSDGVFTVGEILDRERAEREENDGG